MIEICVFDVQFSRLSTTMDVINGKKFKLRRNSLLECHIHICVDADTAFCIFAQFSEVAVVVQNSSQKHVMKVSAIIFIVLIVSLEREKKRKGISLIFEFEIVDKIVDIFRLHQLLLMAQSYEKLYQNGLKLQNHGLTALPHVPLLSK